MTEAYGAEGEVKRMDEKGVYGCQLMNGTI
jgi:hypothetical protein